MIYETVVYDGAMKYWRILNLSTSTVYSSHFPTREEAYAAIEHGQKRGDQTVWRVKFEDISHCLTTSLCPT